MIDDNIIKEKISRYKNCNDVLKEIKDYLSQYTYNYPRKTFHINHDKAVDFYIYYMERIEKILSSYNITDVKFITWFTYTLRNSYLNYAKKTTNKLKYKIYELSLDKPLVNDEGLSLHELIPSINYNGNDNDYSCIEKLYNDIESKYKTPNKLIFEMHYLEVFLYFIIPSIMDYFKLDYNQSFELCQKARLSYLNKYQSFMETQDKITVISSKIKLLEKNKLDDDTIIKLKDRKQKYLKRLKSLRVVVPYNFLSEMFSISENSTTKIIIKIRNYIKVYFKN